MATAEMLVSPKQEHMGQPNTCALEATGVLITSINHPSHGAGGEFFFFSSSDWQRVFGSAVSGSHAVQQWRDGVQIWSGTVVVWDNKNGVHGRRDSGKAAGQWCVNDTVHPAASTCNQTPPKQESMNQAEVRTDENLAQQVSHGNYAQPPFPHDDQSLCKGDHGFFWKYYDGSDLRSSEFFETLSRDPSDIMFPITKWEGRDIMFPIWSRGPCIPCGWWGGEYLRKMLPRPSPARTKEKEPDPGFVTLVWCLLGPPVYTVCWYGYALCGDLLVTVQRNAIERKIHEFHRAHGDPSAAGLPYAHPLVLGHIPCVYQAGLDSNLRVLVSFYKTQEIILRRENGIPRRKEELRASAAEELPAKKLQAKLNMDGWALERADPGLTKQLAALLEADPAELGKGRDAGAYDRNYSRLVLEAAWLIHAPDRLNQHEVEQRTIQRAINNAQWQGLEFKEIQTKLDSAISSLKSQNGGALAWELNEKWLLHGTKPENILPILQDGLNERLSGGVFGKGIYLTEDAAKMDQYCMPDKWEDKSLYKLHAELYDPMGPESTQHPKEDMFYGFVCRATLGNVARTMNGKTQLNGEDLFASADMRDLAYVPNSDPPLRYHSLLAEVGEKILRFREFVVFDQGRVHEEYLIGYRRVSDDGVPKSMNGSSVPIDASNDEGKNGSASSAPAQEAITNSIPAESSNTEGMFGNMPGAIKDENHD